jgi:hypothetical protein
MLSSQQNTVNAVPVYPGKEKEWAGSIQRQREAVVDPSKLPTASGTRGVTDLRGRNTLDLTYAAEPDHVL